MRFVALILICFLSPAYSQEENDRTFIGFGLEGNINLLDEPTLSFSEYKDVIADPTFFTHSTNAELIATDNFFNRNGVKMRFMFRGPDNQNLGAFKQSRFVVGALYNGGNNYTFDFKETQIKRADTVTLTSSTGYSETLYRDTIFYFDTRYTARSRNVGLFFEYLIHTGEGMPGLITGLGISTDMTLQYVANVENQLTYSTGLYDEGGVAKYTPLIYNHETDSYSYGLLNRVSNSSSSKNIKTAYFIRPYIPVKIEARLSNRPNLFNFTVDINAKIGTEVQINPGASVNARMFYSVGLGLNYYL